MTATKVQPIKDVMFKTNKLSDIYFPVEETTPNYALINGVYVEIENSTKVKKDILVVVPDREKAIRIQTASNNYHLTKNEVLFEDIRFELENLGIKDEHIKYDIVCQQYAKFMVKITIDHPDFKFNVNRDFPNKPKDWVCPMIFVENSYDKSCKLAYYMGAYRLVCKNGLTRFEKRHEAAYKHGFDSFELFLAPLRL